jgi:hypothetical protein
LRGADIIQMMKIVTLANSLPSSLSNMSEEEEPEQLILHFSSLRRTAEYQATKEKTKERWESKVHINIPVIWMEIEAFLLEIALGSSTICMARTSTLHHT